MKRVKLCVIMVGLCFLIYVGYFFLTKASAETDSRGTPGKARITHCMAQRCDTYEVNYGDYSKEAAYVSVEWGGQTLYLYGLVKIEQSYK